MNKPVYLGFSILNISKTLMYEFQYDYIKPKYLKKYFKRFMKTLLELKSLLKIKLKKFVVMKNYQWRR